MKKTLSYMLLCIALLATPSCESADVFEDNVTDITSSDSLYTISLGTANFEVEAETRAGNTKTIYGINVEYYKNGTRQGYYAYGLFDDMSTATITLIGGYTYTFTCSIVRSAGNSLWYGPYSYNSFSGYANPFQLDNSASTQCQNKFVEGTGNYLSGLGSGTAVVKSSTETSGYTSLKNPSLERYYGVLADFNPATDGTKVIIPVNKAYFGCKLILKGVKNGVLSTSCNTDGFGFLSASTTKNDNVSEGQIYDFADVAACWTNSNYSQTISLNYNYRSNNNDLFGNPTIWNLSGSKSITFKRNVMTTITVSVTEDLSGASVGVSLEEMGPDNEIEFRVDDDYSLYQVEN